MPNIAQAAPVLAALALLAMAVPEAHALSPRAQLESGVPMGEISCPDGKVLLESPRGTPACVGEQSAGRLVDRGFVLVPQAAPAVQDADMQPPATGPDADTHPTGAGQDADPPSQAPNREPAPDAEPAARAPAEPKLTTLRVASPVGFVDDGREYDRVLQRSASPEPMYDKIMAIMTVEGGGMVVGQSGDATFATVEHEKYSVNPGIGFYPEDWLPTYIPDGYKLLFGGTRYETYAITVTEYEEYKAFHRFVPTTFELHPDITDYDLDSSKGFLIQVVKTTAPIDEIEDMIEGRKELYSKPPVWYGGYKEMEREGLPVAAFEGGNDLNRFRSHIYWQFADDSYMIVSSYYLTLDEIIPIFESIKT